MLAVTLVEAKPRLLRVQPGRVCQVLRRVVDREAKGADALVQLVVGELAGTVRGGMQILRLCPFREAADSLGDGGIEAPQVVAGPGDGHRVQKDQEVHAESFE